MYLAQNHSSSETERRIWLRENMCKHPQPDLEFVGLLATGVMWQVRGKLCHAIWNDDHWLAFDSKEEMSKADKHTKLELYGRVIVT